MTPLETLQKYGLKTDVKSIRERIEATLHLNNKEDHYSIVVHSLTEQELSTKNPREDVEERSEHRSLQLLAADLSLLCSLAEKGERENKLLELYRQFFVETNINIDVDGSDIEDVSTTFDYVDIYNEGASVDTVRRIQELEAEGEGKCK